MSFEYVYIFTNPCMPEWVKVGKTNNIKRRLSDLNKKTAVPLPFECYAYLKVPADLVFNVERGLHSLLGRSLDKEKEFFRTKPETVYEYFLSIEGFNPLFVLERHPNLESEIEEKKTAVTTFEFLGIPLGAVLYFSRDSSVSCTVTDQTNQVTYKGQVYSVSGLAMEFLGYNANGYKYFLYEDETLWSRRVRMYPNL